MKKKRTPENYKGWINASRNEEITRELEINLTETTQETLGFQRTGQKSSRTSNSKRHN